MHCLGAMHALQPTSQLTSHHPHACLLPPIAAVAVQLFYPGMVASGAPARLLQHWWPRALGPSICAPAWPWSVQ